MQSFEQLQVRFLDRIVYSLELLIDLKTAKKFGEKAWLQSEGVEDKLKEAGSQAAKLRTQARAMGRVFSFDHLVTRFDLSPLEANVLLIALAPSIEPEIRDRIGHFYNDMNQDFLTIDFALKLFLDDRTERLDALKYFTRDAKLFKNELLYLRMPRMIRNPGFQHHSIVMSEHVASYIMGLSVLDRLLIAFAGMEDTPVKPDDLYMDGEEKQRLIDLTTGWSAGDVTDTPLVFEVEGRAGTGKSKLSNMIATVVGRPLIRVDSAKMANTDANFSEVTSTLFHEAWMRNAVLVFEQADALFGKKDPRLPVLYEGISRYPGLVFLITTAHSQLSPSLERLVSYKVKMDLPSSGARLNLWTRALNDAGIAASDLDIAMLANTFEITGAQVENAVRMAINITASRGLEHVGKAELEEGAYAQIRAELDDYALKRRIRLTLDDLILPDHEKDSVREVMDAAKNRAFIMTKWGFDRRLATGKGLVVMFIGEPGTGKTLCAEILASELDQGLYQISIPRIMSKYIGETEKNIEQVFQQARATNSILLFDEADALFTKRVKVQTSIDRFSNMEVNLLLQEIERFNGIVILTSNLEKNIDKAFERRINFKIRFPFPEPVYRAEIWEKLFPRECPLDDSIEWDIVGENFELSGGHIKNAVLRAAYMAARRREPVSMKNIIDAAEAEAKAAGRLFRRPQTDD